MAEQDEPKEAELDFVPAICFLPRGIAKERPEKIVLTQAELARVIEDTKAEMDSDNDGDTDDNEDSDNNMDIDAQLNANRNSNDEYSFNNYDNEEVAQVARIGNIVEPDEQIADEDEDSEAEDEIIKPTDNLILVGHVQDETASLEVWVFNEEEESLYTHHDFLLPSLPLCVEWLTHDPGSDKPGNMCAIGCMSPVITIWDLDIQDSIEPVCKLGSKGSRRKQKSAFGHTNAVLDLSWNRHYDHILASGSVDESLILWDLDECEPHTTITTFRGKVQSLEFHPDEAQTILTGCTDNYVRLFDCRDRDAIDRTHTKWKTTHEVEKVLWNPCETNHFIAGTNDGRLFYADKRAPNVFLWESEAHGEEISGICFNKQIGNLLITTSTDGILKVWDFNATSIKEVYTHNFDMGRLLCMKQSPEDPFTIAIGGSKLPRCRVYNIKNFEAVRTVFKIPEVE